MPRIQINPKTDALLVIDVQPTFMPGGGLAVTGGDEIMPNVHRLMSLFPKDRRFATKDRHPRGHISLASSYNELAPYTLLTLDAVGSWTKNHIADHALFNQDELVEYLINCNEGAQVLWPDHAIAGDEEAELFPSLTESDFQYVLTKGMNPYVDSYSGISDNCGEWTEMRNILNWHGVARVFVCGLAYDYCVGFTAIDAARDMHLESFVVKDACRAVSIGSSVESIEKGFAIHHVRIINSKDLINV